MKLKHPAHQNYLANLLIPRWPSSIHKQYRRTALVVGQDASHAESVKRSAMSSVRNAMRAGPGSYLAMASVYQLQLGLQVKPAGKK